MLGGSDIEAEEKEAAPEFAALKNLQKIGGTGNISKFAQSQFNKFLKLYLILETFGCQFEMIIASKICVMLIRVLETDVLVRL